MLSRQTTDMLNRALAEAMAEAKATQADVDRQQAALDETRAVLKTWTARVAELRADLK